MSKIHFKFGLRAKSILIAFLSAILLLVFFLFYAIPTQEKQAVSSLTEASKRHLKTLSIAVVSPLLKQQFALIHELLDSQKQMNNQWAELTLVSVDGNNIYPLIKEHKKLQDDEIYSEVEVVFLDKKLGVLTLVSNISQELKQIHQQVYENVLIVLALLFVLLLSFLWFIEKTITRPLDVLNQSFRALSSHQYHAILPKIRNDEVGNVITGFKAMREKLFNHEHEINNLYETEKAMTEKLRNMVEHVESAHQEAMDANRAKAEFLANMSHEIRTPLNAVSGIIYLLKHMQLNSQQAKYVNTIYRSMAHITHLIDDILDFSRIDAGKLELQSEFFDLDLVLDDLVAFIREDAEIKQLEILFNIPLEVPRALIGDAVRLTQILTNLSRNAIKFSEQGEVLLSVNIENIDKNNITLSFAIKDQGIGISPTHVEHLFDAFSQADTSLTRKFGGIGLGLTISNYLVQAMKGEIEVQSTLGQGSEFRFSVTLGLQPFDKYKPFIVPADLRNLRVLIVDDSETCRQVLSAILTELSFSYVTVNSGQSAIDLLQENYASLHESGFDLVLLDWMMPVMNGLETAIEITNKKKFPNSPLIIMVSAYDKEDVMLQTHEIGVYGYLPKPVNASVLYDTIMQEMGKNLPKAHWRRNTSDQIKRISLNVQGWRVLVVEDQPTNRQIVTEILLKNGFIVEAVENGKIAVELISNNMLAFDVVLMDLQMPVMDGYEATRLIRQTADKNQLPIIAMTAHALESEREKCHEVGMNSHISKPINVENMLAEIGRSLGFSLIAEEPISENLSNSLPEQVPGIDLKDGLQRLIGNTTLYCRLLKGFPTHYQSVLETIHKTIVAGDFEAAAAASHTMAGSAGNLSMIPLRKSCKSLQDALQQGAPFEQLLQKLDSQFYTVIRSIHDLGLVDKNQLTAQEDESTSADEKINAEELVKNQQIYETLSPLIDKLMILLKTHDLSAQKQLELILAVSMCENDIKVFRKIAMSILHLNFSDAMVTLKQFARIRNLTLKDDNHA